MMRPRKNIGPKMGVGRIRHRFWNKGLGFPLAAALVALSLILGGCATGTPAGPATDGALACQDRYRECLDRCRGTLAEEKRDCEIQCGVNLDTCLRRR